MADLRASGLGGVPFGNTANRPSSPIIGQVYYNGELEILEIYNGTGWVANSAPPSTPSIATPTDASTGDAYSATGGKLSVVFTNGNGGGAPSQYNTFTTVGDHNASSSNATVTLTGLTPGTAYTVYGNVQNNFGTTVNTPNSAAVTPTTLPEAPTIGSATFNSSNSQNIDITWTLGNNGGKNLTSITIIPYLNGTTAGTPQTAATTSSTSHTFTDLIAGNSYTFKVKVTNDNGNSPESSATNSIVVPVIVYVDYLVIAGGGGGSHGNTDSRQSSGGGAGGLRSSYSATGGGGSLESPLALAVNTNYTVTVGAGGSANGDGTNSVFASITSLKGGRGGEGGGGNGGGGNGTYGSGGGQGGSGGGATQNNAQGTPGQGFQGGYATFSGQDAAGGGGGAGSAGGNASGSTAGVGGNGIYNNITGTSIGYAGGGGNNGNLGFGGGYNGDGNTRQGVVNKGGGGKGNSAAGGSGVVILRWLTSATNISVGAGLTADATGTDGSYSYKRFTAGSGNVSFS